MTRKESDPDFDPADKKKIASRYYYYQTAKTSFSGVRRGLNDKFLHIKLCFVVLKAWVEKQCKLSNLVLLSAGLGQRRSINKQNGGLGYLVFGCPLTSFALRKLGLFEFIFLNN